MARIDGSPDVECSCRTKGPVVVVGTEVVCERCRLPRYMHLDQRNHTAGGLYDPTAKLDPNNLPVGRPIPLGDLPPWPEQFVAGDSGDGKNVVGLPVITTQPGHNGVFNLSETVDHPDHYGGADDPYEAIKVIEAWGLNFSLGCVLKYICRREKKGDVIEQLKKARWYLDREIARLQGTV